MKQLTFYASSPEYTGMKVWINMDLVQRMEPTKAGGSVLTYPGHYTLDGWDNEQIHVSESPEEILSKAER